MTHPAETIKQLREASGAGIVDVGRALDEAKGDSQKAAEILRVKGVGASAKKAHRTAGEGTIGSYVHTDGKTAALVTVACETDFVARTKDFQDLAHDLALHVVAARPEYLSRADVPVDIVEKERAIARESTTGKKPDAVIEKIVEGKLAKFYAEHCLLDQLFVKDDSVTIAELIERAVAKLGEKVEILTFVRFVL